MEQLQSETLSALDVIFARRSVRAYTSTRVDAATIQSLLDAAVQAPTATHAEPWAFVVVQDRSILKRISDRAKARWIGERSEHRHLHPAARDGAGRSSDPDSSIFYDTGTLIAICATSVGPFVAADCWLAAENLMLAAAALGLGSCCIGSAVPALNLAETKTELGISDEVAVVVPIIVGVPRERGQESARQAPTILRWLK